MAARIFLPLGSFSISLTNPQSQLLFLLNLFTSISSSKVHLQPFFFFSICTHCTGNLTQYQGHNEQLHASESQISTYYQHPSSPCRLVHLSPHWITNQACFSWRCRTSRRYILNDLRQSVSCVMVDLGWETQNSGEEAIGRTEGTLGWYPQEQFLPLQGSLNSTFQQIEWATQITWDNFLYLKSTVYGFNHIYKISSQQFLDSSLTNWRPWPRQVDTQNHQTH